jgi:hypothetical protein
MSEESGGQDKRIDIRWCASSWFGVGFDGFVRASAARLISESPQRSVLPSDLRYQGRYDG